MRLLNHIASCAAALLLTHSALGQDPISFSRDIKPILSDRCFKCHGPDAQNQRSDYRLDTAEHAYADLFGDGSFFGIVPGDPENSEVVYRMRTDDEDEIMPPQKSKMSVSEEEIRLIEKWIEQGAEYDTHWSFKPLPKKVEVPDSGSDWARNPVDEFILSGFKQHGTQAAEASPKHKWLRRATFDLTGLPPSPQEVKAFIADDSNTAYETVVDRLLKTTAYAERMTTEWLDVARYSDSNGYQRDDIRDVYPYRDWVINAFKDNMRYDEFVTLQVAGDLLPNATQEQILPTAFNRLHAHKKEGGIVLEEYRVEYVADRTQTFSAAFLGLTMDCARCHDHKYDQLPTRDYYALSSFFDNIDESGLISYFTDAVPTPAMPLATKKQDQALAKATKKIQEAAGKLDNIAQQEAAQQAFEQWLGEKPEQRPTLTWPGHVVSLSMDERDGEFLTNAVRPDNPAKTFAANKLVDGRKGKAIQFTGDDYLNVKGEGLFPREHPFSAALWINPSQQLARQNLFSRGAGADDAASLGYEFLLIDGKPTVSLIHFWPGNGMRVQAVDEVPLNEWTHLAVTYDGSSKAGGLKIYVNGRPVETKVIADQLTRQITDYNLHYQSKQAHRLGLIIGQRYRDRGFVNGLMDSFEMFNRRLADIEVQQLFNEDAYPQLLTRYAENGNDADRQKLYELFLLTEYLPAMTARQKLQQARASWNNQMDAIPAMSIIREKETPRQTYLLDRGGYDNRAEPVDSDTPTALPPFPKDAPRNRLGLAQWLTDTDHPLTARVTVNRYWQMVFGTGLVRTPEDFGSQGSPPTHPELLDWLARDFVESGWDVQHLLKTLVLSSTYRQSTVTDAATLNKDPENISYCRSNPDRLTAEMIRDNALATSGLLVNKIGGKPVKPYDLAVSFEPMKPDQGEGLYRRSLYTLWKRNAPAPMMVTFDASKRDVCILKREATTSPLQPLVTLNGPQFIEAARVLGQKLIAKHQDNRQAVIEEAFYLLISRDPSDEEIQILLDLYESQRKAFDQKPADANKLLKIGNAELSLTESPREHAAATIVINAIMNLNESLIQR